MLVVQPWPLGCSALGCLKHMQHSASIPDLVQVFLRSSRYTAGFIVRDQAKIKESSTGSNPEPTPNPKPQPGFLMTGSHTRDPGVQRSPGAPSRAERGVRQSAAMDGAQIRALSLELQAKDAKKQQKAGRLQRLLLVEAVSSSNEPRNWHRINTLSILCVYIYVFTCTYFHVWYFVFFVQTKNFANIFDQAVNSGINIKDQQGLYGKQGGGPTFT